LAMSAGVSSVSEVSAAEAGSVVFPVSTSVGSAAKSGGDAKEKNRAARRVGTRRKEGGSMKVLADGRELAEIWQTQV
jgi:hypothetical protein